MASIDELTDSILKSDSVGLGVDAIISWIPGVSGFCIPDEVWDILLNGKDRNVVVYDVSYLPKQTELLKQAELYKWQTVTGIQMLIAQAWEQSKIFTGKIITDKTKREEVENEVYKFYEKL